MELNDYSEALLISLSNLEPDETLTSDNIIFPRNPRAIASNCTGWEDLQDGKNW